MVLMYSCENQDDGETKISTHHSAKSHNTGKNCMECHSQEAFGEGWFTVAGSVYDSTQNSIFPNATVWLYTGPSQSGELMLELEGDQLGNFYTTENIDFGNGLYASVEGKETTKHMSSSLETGECNSCHGNGIGRIWTK